MITEALRLAAYPPKGSADAFEPEVLPLLKAGIARADPDLAALQTWLATSMASRAALEAEMDRGWLALLRPYLDEARGAERAACAAFAADARTVSPPRRRAAIARAFRESEWAEEDAAIALGAPLGVVTTEALGWLLPYVRAEAT